jgi:hypothetical protein
MQRSPGSAHAQHNQIALARCGLRRVRHQSRLTAARITSSCVSHREFHKVFPNVDKSHRCHFDGVRRAASAWNPRTSSLFAQDVRASHLCRNSRTRSFLMRCTRCKVCKATGTNVQVTCALVSAPGCGDSAGTPPGLAGPRASDSDVLSGVAVKLKGGLPYEQVFITDGPGVSIAGG